MSRRLAALLSIVATLTACAEQPPPVVAPPTPAPVAVAPADAASPARCTGEDEPCALTLRCVAGDLDEPARSKAIAFLADARDQRAEPCFVKTLRDYQPGRTEEDVRHVCRAVAAMKLRAAAGPLLDVFKRLRASTPQGGAAYRDVHDAMVALADPGWEEYLVATLARPVDPKAFPAVTDEMFWQITAAELLGDLRSEKAVRPLLALLLTPPKAAAHADAVYALVKIGKPSVGPAVALLRGEDQELVALARAEAAKAAAGDKHAEKAPAVAHVAAAGLVLATIGREEAAGPMIEALGKADGDLTRAILARELVKLPRTPATIKAFQRAYEKLPVTLGIPNSRGGAREVLLETVPGFLDASFVPWMKKMLVGMKGDPADLDPIRERTMEAMLKLATKSQIRFIEGLAGAKAADSTLGAEYAKEIRLVKDVLGRCADSIDCYLGVLVDPKANTDTTQFAGIRAAYQLGVLGDAGVRGKIMEAFPRISHPAVRYAALTVVDALSPHGDLGIAAQLQTMVDDAAAAKDAGRMRQVAMLKQFVHRLRGRAAP